MQSETYLKLLEEVDLRVHELVDEMRELHVRKSNGYSGVDNPDTWANFRNSVDYGVTPLQGCLVRKEDKIARVKSLLRNPSAAGDETIEDTWKDEAAYALIAICLYREEQKLITPGGVPLEKGKWYTFGPIEGAIGVIRSTDGGLVGIHETEKGPIPEATWMSIEDGQMTSVRDMPLNWRP